MTDDGTPAEDTRPWRKRHPVLSRSILYALGIGLATLLAVLYLSRKEEDAASALDALRGQLNDLSLVLALDPDGTQVLRILDEKFADPELPVDMQGRALRWRALAHRRGGRHTEAEAALQAASALDLPARERLALAVEWAEARSEAGDLTGAMKVLPPVEQAIDGPLGMLRDVVFARVHFLLKADNAATRRLAGALGRFDEPLPDGPEDYVGGRPWTPSQVATVMSEMLVNTPRERQPDPRGDARIWGRLERIAPRDFDAQVAATRGYLALERRQDALRCWQRAEALEPAQAATLLRSDSVLARLK